MKKTTFCLFLTFVLFGTNFGQKPKKGDNFVKVDKNLYVSRYEVTNLEYSQFLNDFRGKVDEKSFTAVLPDSLQWNKNLTEKTPTRDLQARTRRESRARRDPQNAQRPLDRQQKTDSTSKKGWRNALYVREYHNHSNYLQYPVVNITKTGMKAYCKWMEDKYMSNPKRAHAKVHFRLPTEKEWMKFAAPLPGQRVPWIEPQPYSLDKKGNIVPLANIKVVDYTQNKYDYTFDGALYTTYIGKYKPNKPRLFDIIGNVAEMTFDNKIKGGSWENTLEESFIDLSQPISVPDPRVGFRVVMEVLEEQK